MKFLKSAENGCDSKGSSFLTRCLSWKATLAAGIVVFLLFFYLLPLLVQKLAVTETTSFSANVAIGLMNDGFPLISRQLGIIAGGIIVAVALLKLYRRRAAHSRPSA